MVENLIYQAIMNAPELSNALAAYAEKPAVFYQQAPNDKEAGWNGGMMFPRVTYNVDWQYNPERKAAGSLMLEVFCLNESSASPEDIAAMMVNALSEVFLTDETGSYCVVWNRTDSFEIAGDSEPQTIGAAVSFDILAFPVQGGVSPDPVRSTNAFIKAVIPECQLIGYDRLESVWKPTESVPAVYVRLASNVNAMRSSYAVAWMKATLNVHVISPSPANRQKWLQELAHILSIEGEIIMDDHSPMLLQGSLNLNTSADPLHNGQLTIVGQYGVLRKEAEDPVLNHAAFVQEGLNV